MGLELGPPWLVLAKSDPNAGGAEILCRDNFTGSSLLRLISARKAEPGSFAAVMAADGRFALHPDGRIYDPIEETKGRNGGTAAERGHRALLTAEALFRQMGGMSWADATRPPTPGGSFGQALKWAVAVVLLLVALGLIGRITQ
ncbi:hypothetical protein [Rhodobacter xanthinilyticus]|uniref:hypothetical protein n=1 Tax=Rhodobacter xanthinilyticus TaxID=1850250 RepID=UPI0012EBDCA9|nr:hypothetical protein [Rhodobacter xanthinilyticus]